MSKSTMWLPMNPAPPVTTARALISLLKRSRQVSRPHPAPSTPPHQGRDGLREPLRGPAVGELTNLLDDALAARAVEGRVLDVGVDRLDQVRATVGYTHRVRVDHGPVMLVGKIAPYRQGQRA